MTLYVPRAYQKTSTQHILDNPGCGLLIDMSLGKTAATLTAIVELMHDRFEVERTLVIAPLRVAESVWPAETAKWRHLAGLTLEKVLGSRTERLAALKKPADIYVINRENVEWLVEHYGRNWPFDMVILDELSSFKNPKAKRFRALRKILPLINRIVGLTGTPATNGLIDLWAQIYLLDRGERLGKTVTGYRDRYFEPGRRDPKRHIIFDWEPKTGAEESIYRKIGDICVSVRAESNVDLPERVYTNRKVLLGAKARADYERLRKEYILPCLAEGGADVLAGSAAALSNKLLQLANGAVYDEVGGVREVHSAKLDALEELIEEANGRPVMVAYCYRHDLSRLKKRFRKAQTLNTAQDVERWNAGDIPMLLAHPASVGHGLNLQFGGNVTIWFGLTWNLEHYLQLNARLRRPGQPAPCVRVIHLVTEDTIDERALAALGQKNVGQEALLNALRAEIGLYEVSLDQS